MSVKTALQRYVDVYIYIYTIYLVFAFFCCRGVILYRITGEGVRTVGSFFSSGGWDSCCVVFFYCGF